MADYDLFQRITRNIAQGTDEGNSDLIAQIPDEDEDEFNAYVAVVFGTAVEYWFREDQSHEALRRFANELRQDFRSLDPPINTLTMEGILRVFFGEQHLLDSIDPSEQMTLQCLALRKMVDQSSYLQEHFEQYLQESVEVTKDLMAE